MITLIYGGSASGKSSFAEQAVMKLSPESARYYIATMKVYGEEGKRRVKRHVELREGKGFQTIECPVDITACLQQIPEPSEAVLLIECVSNLAANEMFDKPQSPENSRQHTGNDCHNMEYDRYSAQSVTRKVTRELRELCRQVKHAVIVTNNIFEDGAEYARETKEYIQCLGQINRALANMADEVIEVIAGIPVDPASHRDAHGTKGTVQAMRLIIGGTAQGKRDYVTGQLQRQDMAYCLIDENGPQLADIPQDAQVLVLDHLHLIIRKFGAEDPARAFLRQITDFCETTARELIIICDEVGNGVVPLSGQDRDYREHVGRILCDLAREATSIERVICGIPVYV